MLDLQAEADAILDGTLPRPKPKPYLTGMDALVGKKTRGLKDGEVPYIVIQAQGWTWKVLNRNGKSAKDFAIWFLATSSPYTHGSEELGDGYVRDTVLYGRLATVDGRMPTAAELVAYDDLRSYHANRPDPARAMGF